MAKNRISKKKIALGLAAVGAYAAAKHLANVRRKLTEDAVLEAKLKRLARMRNKWAASKPGSWSSVEYPEDKMQLVPQKYFVNN